MFSTRRYSRIPRWLKILVLATTLLTAAMVLIFVGAPYWLNRYVPQLEQSIGDATGFETHIRGGIRLTLFPAPGISLGDIDLRKGAQTGLSVQTVEVGFALSPLLNKEFRIHVIETDRLRLRLPAGPDGMPMLPAFSATSKTPPRSTVKLHFDSLHRVEMRDSDVIVVSPNGDETRFLKGANLTLHPLNPASALEQNTPQELAVSATLDFKQAKIRRLLIGPSRLKLQHRPNSIRADISRASVFDGAGKGRLHWRMENKTAMLGATISLMQFDAGQSAALFQREPFVEGRLDLETDVQTRGTRVNEMIQQATGTVRLAGNDIRLVSVNLDDLVSKIVKYQSYNLVDAAAYFFIGPLATSATKGYDFASVMREMRQPGVTPNSIKRLVSTWELADGFATAKDVALETARYRLALKGRIDLMKNRFDNIRVAVIDDRGCALVSQNLDGPFSSPRIEKVNILLTLTKPMLDVIGKSAKRLLVGNCEPFYSGELLAPPAVDENAK